MGVSLINQNLQGKESGCPPQYPTLPISSEIDTVHPIWPPLESGFIRSCGGFSAAGQYRQERTETWQGTHPPGWGRPS